MAERRKFYRAAPQAAREVLAVMKLTADAGRQRVFDGWETLLPARLRGHVRPLRWEKTTLWLTVDGPVWAQEVRMLAPELMRTLNALTGAVLVRDVKTKVLPPRAAAGGTGRTEIHG
ncbi:MAG TPA: DUF721 domain-containing protein [bacterium]|nr:DUF721 domain-containing protein [bacterium]